MGHRFAPMFSFLFFAAFAMAADWPAFRGAAGDGVSKEETVPLHWGGEDKSKNVRWKSALPAPGNSSPIVSHGRVLVTCATDNGTRRSLYCFDRKNGQQLWIKTVENAPEPTHKTNPFCASTPAADGERVVVWHGSAGIFCYTLDGRELWKKDLGQQQHDWGYASSPIIHDGRVILNFGPGERSFLTALDLKSGDVLWKHDEPGGLSSTGHRMVGSWSTPMVVKIDGREQVLCSMPTRLIGCDARDGTLLWWCQGLGTDKVDMVFPMPVVAGDVAVACSGWVNGPTMGVRLGGRGGRGSGDLTATNRLWLEKRPQSIGTGVALDGNLYIVNAGPGTAQCIECRSGNVRWKATLEGGESWGSVVMAAGRLYVTSRRGITSVFAPRPDKFELLAANDLGEASNATPAISDGEIFLRTDGGVYCIWEK